MSTIATFFFFVGIFILLPIVAYLVMKFGTAGYLRAKEREREKKHEK